MISLKTIKRVARCGEDYDRAAALKADIARLRRARPTFYLTHLEVEPIFRWKLGSQYGRTATLRNANSDATVREVTRVAFAINLADRSLELRLRTAALCTLSGVGVPVASAMLAMSDPDHYGIVDFRVWRQVFGREKRNFGVTDYLAYMECVWPLAAQLGWTAQEVDWAIWHHDKLHYGNAQSRNRQMS